VSDVLRQRGRADEAERLRRTRARALVLPRAQLSARREEASLRPDRKWRTVADDLALRSPLGRRDRGPAPAHGESARHGRGRTTNPGRPTGRSGAIAVAAGPAPQMSQCSTGDATTNRPTLSECSSVRPSVRTHWLFRSWGHRFCAV